VNIVEYRNFRTGRIARTQTFGAALGLNLRVLGALLMREGIVKYGHHNLGFFWVMGEPLFLTVGVMGMWALSGRLDGHNIGIVPMALSGYVNLTLWRHLTGRAVHIIRENVGLLFHRNVRVFDVLLAHNVLEILGLATAFLIAYVPLALLGILDPMRDPLTLIGGYLLNAWFGLAVGLIISGLSELWMPVQQFVPPMLYITLPFTGAFYMVCWVPQRWREALLWSPLVNTQEMFRSGMFSPDITTYYYPWYVVSVCVILTAIGIPLVQIAQKRVSMQ
jgi:capsular polysaccharide transport system permease protein